MNDLPNCEKADRRHSPRRHDNDLPGTTAAPFSFYSSSILMTRFRVAAGLLLLIGGAIFVLLCVSIPLQQQGRSFLFLRKPIARIRQRKLFAVSLLEPDPASILSKIPKPSLELIHITKTGGSAIEEAAAVQANIQWGACHYWDIPRQKCRHPDWKMRVSQNRAVMPPLKYMGEPWHMPPHWQIPNRYLGKDTFVVVRNPYDRVISEFGCSAFGYHEDDRDDPTVFNDWVQRNLREAAQIMKGHMLPQHYYVYDSDQNMLVTHVLRFEYLHEQFDALMRLYDLPVRLPPVKKPLWNQRQAVRKMTFDDFSTETIRQINEFYANDFELLGYFMTPV